MSKEIELNKSYKQLLQDIVKEIESHKVKAAWELNATQMQLYFSIGILIVQKQKEEGWGKAIVEQLAIDLPKIIEGAKSYSNRNLWYMRQFFLIYDDLKDQKPLAFQIPWGQNILILTKIDDDDQRYFYLSKTIEAGWSRKTLLNMIKARSYENQMVDKKSHNFSQTLPTRISKQADQILKSTYILEFLKIEEDILERQLENRLIQNIKNFILELGYGFTYIGNQYKLQLQDKEYFQQLRKNMIANNRSSLLQL